MIERNRKKSRQGEKKKEYEREREYVCVRDRYRYIYMYKEWERVRASFKNSLKAGFFRHGNSLIFIFASSYTSHVLYTL